MPDTEGHNQPQVAPASTPTPAPKPSFLATLAANWKKILLAVLVFVFHIVSSFSGLYTLVGHALSIGVSKVSGISSGVTISTGSVSYMPKATKANPKPTAIYISKAPDDKVDVQPGVTGNNITIHRFSFILEPTVGELWTGSFSGDDAFESVLGLRLVKYSQVGLGTVLTTKRYGVTLDYRIDNITIDAGLATSFGVIAPGLVASVNIIPF